MKTDNDLWQDKAGGAAFPLSVPKGPVEFQAYRGMSLRDYFAAAALTGVVMAGIQDDPTWLEDSVAAEYAYAYADAMLKEREKT